MSNRWRQQRIEDRLSDRDQRILRFVSDHRFATTIHIRRMFFAGHATPLAAARACVRVLDRLYSERLLGRLERRIGGVKHGSASFIWHLDIQGERLTRPDGVAKRLVRDPSVAFVDHALAVVDVRVRIEEAAREGAFTVERIEVETAAWRSYLDARGTTTMLKPDLMATTSSGDYEDHWYIEIDRGTESLPVLLRQSRAYADYRRTGRPQAEHGVMPRVLWAMPTQRRVARLKAAIAATADLPDRLFTVLTTEELIPAMCDPPP